jgi:hypothetical protein
MRVVISSQDQWVLIMIFILEFFFLKNEDTYFDEVNRQFRLLENQYFFSIRAQYNTGGTSTYYLCLILVRYEVEWRMIFQMTIIEMNWKMVELYVKILSIDNVGDSLNNISEIINRTENIISYTIKLVHQIHEPDPQRPYIRHLSFQMQQLKIP